MSWVALLAFGGAPSVQRDQLLDPCHEPRQRLRCRVTTEQLGDRAQRFLGAAGTMLDECQAATRQRHLLASGVEGLPQGHEAFRRRGGRRSPLCSRTSRASTRCACATSPLLPASRRCPGLLGHGIPGTKPSRVRATVRSARAMRKEPPPADAITPATPRTNDSRLKRGAVGHEPVLCAWLSLWKFWTCWTVSVPGPAHAAAVPGVNVVVHLLVASWPLPSSHPK